jgi:hypothetical protein
MTPKQPIDKNGQGNDGNGDRHLPKDFKFSHSCFSCVTCYYFKIPGLVSSQVKKFFMFVASAQTEETSQCVRC